MITVKLNEDDMRRILRKLNTTLALSASHPFKWKLKLLNEYTATVTEAMGTLEARGGYPHIHFEASTSINRWNSLRPYTIKVKLARRGVKFSKGAGANPGQLYREYASELTIWMDTGETKQAVTRQGNFAGIAAGEALRKGNVVEEGDPERRIKARPLFSVANHLIITTVHTMLGNDRSWLAEAMRKEFHSLAVSNGWGS